MGFPLSSIALNPQIFGGSINRTCYQVDKRDRIRACLIKKRFSVHLKVYATVLSHVAFVFLGKRRNKRRHQPQPSAKVSDRLERAVIVRMLQ